MPQVPITRGNTVSLNPRPVAAVRPVQIADGIGEGAQQLGESISRAAEVQDHIDEELATAGAKALDNDYVTKAQKIRTDFMATKGLNAGVARPGVEIELKRLREETLGKATTRRMRAILADTINQRSMYLGNEIATHATTQIAAAQDTASVSRQALAAEEAAATSDPIARAENIATGRLEIAERGERNGLGAAWIRSEQFKFESGVHASIVQNLIIGDDIDGAIAYLAAHRGSITDGDEKQLHAMLKDPLERRDTNSYVDRIMGAGTADPGNAFSYTDPLHGAGRQPVPGGQFNASRDYGSHHGVDIPAPMGSPVYPTGPGIAHVSHSKLGGNIVTIDHGDGTVSKYMHLGKVDVKDGERVAPDTTLGLVGMTGRSTGPHLHFEVRKDGKPVDPEKVMGQVRQSPQRHDLSALLARIDADASLTPEQRDRYKREVERRVGQDERLLARREDDARRQAMSSIAEIGEENFTNLAQLPPSVRASLSAEDTVALQSRAAANARGLKVKANGDFAFNLMRMQLNDPESFAQVDLDMVANQMTRSEYEQFRKAQIKIQNDPGHVPSEASAWAMVSRHAPELGLDLGTSKGKASNPEDREKAMALTKAIIADVEIATGGKRAANDQDYREAFDRNVRMVVRDGDTDNPVHLYELGGPAASVPALARDAIRQAWRKSYGRLPTEGEIAATYRAAGGK